ncbi:MAG: hypothetical protein K9J27_09835 [Bacteroidales bacterium]|nr:hypothetical protein [Bacteroidales bacterium]MCF8334277.1 hypothetical protein [Bacteroidales bacterium]
MSKETHRYAVAKSWILLATVFFVSTAAFAQTNPTDQKLSIVEEKIGVIELLKKIENNSAVYFSYSPDFFEGDFVQVKFLDRSIEYILDQLLNPEYKYVVKGREVVIYKNRYYRESETQQSSEQPTVTHEKTTKDTAATEITKEREPPEVHYDTVFLTRYDTISTIDTMMVRDTVIIRDTVYVKKAVKKPYKNSSIFKNTTLEDLRNKDNYLEVYAGPVFNNFEFTDANSRLISLTEKAYASRPSYEAGLMAGRHFNPFLVEVGLGLRYITEDFVYTYSRPSESYYEVDTLDSYYTIQNQDTTWYYITDSTLHSIPGRSEQYQNINHFTFLDVPVSVGYRFNVGNLAAHLKVGIVNSFLVDEGGYYIDRGEFNPVGKYRNAEMNSYVMSGSVSAGVVYYLNDFIAVSGNIHFRKTFAPLFKEKIPVSRNYTYTTGSLGIRYLF